MTFIDLSKTKPIDAVKVLSFAVEYQALKDRFTSLDPDYDNLSDLDPAMLILHALALKIVQYKQFVNERARGATLAFSKGANVDALTALFNVERFVIQPGEPSATPPIPAVWETDEELKRRFLIKLESISGAGPRAAYEFHGLSAHAQVKHVLASSPAPAHVTVAVLSREGTGIPTAVILSAVEAALSDEYVRPVTDRLEVRAAAVTPYAVEVTLFVKPGVDASVIQEQSEEALLAYVEEAHHIGVDIRATRVTSIAASYRVQDPTSEAWNYHLSPNIDHVTVTSPAADVMTDSVTAPYCTGITVHVQEAT